MTFRVGITRDLMTAKGGPCFDARVIDVLKANPAITWEWLPAEVAEITPEIAARYDGLHVNLPRVTARSVASGDCRVKIIARNGVGYDTVDVPALAARGIVVTNTPIAVRRPVAVATMTLLLALAGRLFEKDRLVRSGRWNERVNYMGQGLTTRTLGLIGAGSIGQEIMRLTRPLFGRIIAADPYAKAADVAAAGGELRPFDEVMGASDFIVVCCLLTPETRHLINARALALMKPSAYYLNVGRGPIHDEAVLADALIAGRIAGAGLDVTEVEPLPAGSPLLTAPNTIITPHALCWTDECFDDIARTALTSILDCSEGRPPVHMVDPTAWSRRSGR
jgi:D-3-phosphoglycerate dehydrogenase